MTFSIDGAFTRIASALTLVLASLFTSQVVAQSEKVAEPKIIKAYAYAERGEPKYSPDFEHFEYVNPNAPKGGQIVHWTIGTYDNFNRYASRGSSAIGSDGIYDSLMVANEDEIGVYYPLIAESVEYPENYAWVIFNINPRARDASGKPITAEDVVFSFDKFIEQGVVQVRTGYKNITHGEVLNEHRVKFHFETPDREDVSRLISLPIFPKHFWKDHNLSEPMSSPPLGTGPYRITDYKMGQQVTYGRIKDYWAKDLPSRKGTLNFDVIRYDYYRDSTVALEGFKAGEYDFRQENIAKQWAEEYDHPAVRRGDIVKEELKHEIPQRLQGFIFNTKHKLFTDRRVRQALSYALDFEWMNKNLFYSQYQRSYSYFQNTPYTATGEPSKLELDILLPFKDQLPREVFGEVWTPPVTDGSGNIRPALRDAMALLKDAGWELQNRKLVHSETGEPFEFELLTYTSSSNERVILPYKRNLERLGINLEMREVDTSQFINRIREREFAMVFSGYDPMPYPHPNMRIIWHSDYIEASWNQANVEDPVIDALTEGVARSQEDDDMLMAYGRAFDRVARWNFYIVPQWHSDSFRVAYWNKFSRPEIRPTYSLGIDTWWYDEAKAKTLRR